MHSDQCIRNEDEEQCLAHIKDWLKSEPHLPDEFEDKRILIFLRTCKFSLERCKKKLDMYFTVRTVLPEFFTNRDVCRPEMQNTINLLYMAVLPDVTSEGHRLSILRSKDANGKDFDLVMFVKYIFMMGDVQHAQENTIGDIYILDMTAINPRYFLKTTPALLKKFLVCALEAYPARLISIHLINVWPWMKAIVESLKPFVKKKIWDRLFFHSEVTELFNYVPKEFLPNEYGGKAGPISDLHTATMLKVGEYTNWFKEQESVKSDESLRRDKTNGFDEVFGIHGSFRQLKID